jgi:putative addiction module component (TIGR02574 family)
MSKIEILEELPKLTKLERQEIRLRLAELDSEDWLDIEDPLTVQEKALLDARLSAYANDPDAGSTWEEVEGRIRARLRRQPNVVSAFSRGDPQRSSSQVFLRSHQLRAFRCKYSTIANKYR